MNAPPNAERELLQRLCAGPASGGELARAGGLTRASIWKRIEALRAAGIEIQAQPGRGYALAQPLEWLDAAAIRAGLAPALRTQLAGLEVTWSIDSTNSELLRRTPPARGVAVLLAERQTGGRGRRGRAWASPLAAHLYLSLDRQFSAGLARLGGLSLVAGIVSTTPPIPRSRGAWSDVIGRAYGPPPRPRNHPGPRADPRRRR